MTQHAHMHETAPVSTHADFLARFKKNLVKELVSALGLVLFLIKLFLITTLGIFLFVKDFKFVKIVFALIAPPLFIYIVGSNLTLLSTSLVILMAFVSIMTLYIDKEGDGLVGWFNDVILSLFEGTAESSSSTITQKLMGFVALSAFVSFFIVFIV